MQITFNMVRLTILHNVKQIKMQTTWKLFMKNAYQIKLENSEIVFQLRIGRSFRRLKYKHSYMFPKIK